MAQRSSECNSCKPKEDGLKESLQSVLKLMPNGNSHALDNDELMKVDLFDNKFIRISSSRETYDVSIIFMGSKYIRFDVVDRKEGKTYQDRYLIDTIDFNSMFSLYFYYSECHIADRIACLREL